MSLVTLKLWLENLIQNIFRMLYFLICRPHSNFCLVKWQLFSKEGLNCLVWDGGGGGGIVWRKVCRGEKRETVWGERKGGCERKSGSWRGSWRGRFVRGKLSGQGVGREEKESVKLKGYMAIPQKLCYNKTIKGKDKKCVLLLPTFGSGKSKLF